MSWHIINRTQLALRHHTVCFLLFLADVNCHSIISSVFLTAFELPQRSSHFDSGPKVGIKQATNQVDGLARRSAWTLNRLAAHKLQKKNLTTDEKRMMHM
jgi:hypothetical protein